MLQKGSGNQNRKPRSQPSVAYSITAAACVLYALPVSKSEFTPIVGSGGEKYTSPQPLPSDRRGWPKKT